MWVIARNIDLVFRAERELVLSATSRVSVANLVLTGAVGVSGSRGLSTLVGVTTKLTHVGHSGRLWREVEVLQNIGRRVRQGEVGEVVVSQFVGVWSGSVLDELLPG